MKLTSQTKLGLAVGAGFLALSIYAMAQHPARHDGSPRHGARHSGTPGQPPFGTPPGHHYGWQKGKHNPHKTTPTPTATATPTPTPGTPTPTPTPTP
jgi:hypothetical protein